MADDLWISAPDGSYVKFPAGTPDDVIGKAMSEAYPAPHGDPLLDPSVGATVPADAIDGNATASVPDSVKDVAKTIPSGLARGVAGLVGTPGLIKDGADWMLRKAGGYSAEEQQKRRAGSPGGAFIDATTPTASGAVGAIESATGPLYHPVTRAGKYANTVAEFAPGAIFGSGSTLQRIGQTVAPAIFSEGAGQLTEGTKAEPYARVLGALGGAGATAAVQARGGANSVMGHAMEGITQTDIDAANALRQRAANLPGGGIDIPLDEALNHVTNGRAQRLSQVSRVVANSGGEGGQILNEVYSRRPGQVEAAGRGTFDAIEPRPMDPYVAGPEIQRHAEGAIDAARHQINDTTRPLYQAADPQTLASDVFDLSGFHPGQRAAWEHGVQAVRNDPILGPAYAHLPDNSVGMINAVSGRLRDLGEAASTNPQVLNRQAGGIMQDAGSTAREVARQQVPEYDQALAMQEAGRRYELTPMEHGPVGTLSKTPDIVAQAEGVFPVNPAARSETAVRDAFAGLSAEDQRLAGTLLRQHLEGTFNKATSRLQDGGQNVMGGANFAKAVAGNPQQETNLRAALEAGAGPQSAESVDRLVEALRATGRKPQKGSDTAFNKQLLDELMHNTSPTAKIAGEAAAGAAAGGGVFGMTGAAAGAGLGAKNAISDAITRYRLGSRTAEAARMLTDPSAATAQNLSRMNATSRRDVLAGLLRSGLLGEEAYNGAQPVQ